MSFFVKKGPERSRDLERILELPERDAFALGESIREPLSDLLRTDTGTQTLRPLQAVSLVEAHDIGGVVVLMAVGEGKTLVSFLMPVVLKAKRPLLLVPGKLKQKTLREFEDLKINWQHHPNYRVESYEMVSTHPKLLETLRPDLIVLDESHKLKNKKAGCTKRVWKYWHKYEDITVIPMSGTLSTRSFFDWWHLQLMALPDGLSVLPYDWREMDRWARALDEKIEDRIGLGALSAFGGDFKQARVGFGEKLQKTPGIIASDAQSLKASIYVEIERFDVPKIDKYIGLLNAKWELPNGTELMSGSDMWRHSREIANGFFYYWTEEAPDEWREARKECNAFIRRTLNYSRTYETPSQIFEAYSKQPQIVDWVRVRDTFIPDTAAEWFSADVLEKAMEEVQKYHGILWFEHTAVGEGLKSLGMRVFGSGGMEIETGVPIDKVTGPIAASIGACGEGFNLQNWSYNLLLNCTPSGKTWEQLIGRTHRYGQKADNVFFKLLVTSDVQFDDFKQAFADAEYIQAITGQRQKLTIADVISGEEWKK